MKNLILPKCGHGLTFVKFWRYKMRSLNVNEIYAITGASIKPSQWMISAAGGALVGVASLTITAFAANPISPVVALTVGPLMGIGFHAAYDILHEYGY